MVAFVTALVPLAHADEDLEVEIRPADPTIIAATGAADVIAKWVLAALYARKSGIPLVNIAQSFKHSGLELTCLRSSRRW